MRNGKTPVVQASGVEAVIAQLREEGAAEGRRQAEAILAEAKAEAEAVRASARAEADAVLAHAREEAARTLEAGEEALKTAARDAILRLRGDLLERFSAEFRQMVRAATLDPNLLARLLLEVARQSADLAALEGGEPMEALLPAAAVSLDDLRGDLGELRAAPLTEFVVAATGRVLREGVRLGVRRDGSAGLHVRLDDRDLEIDLSDAALSAVLLEHLQPRFRALFDGIVG